MRPGRVRPADCVGLYPALEYSYRAASAQRVRLKVIGRDPDLQAARSRRQCCENSGFIFIKIDGPRLHYAGSKRLGMKANQGHEPVLGDRIVILPDQILS